VERRGTGEKASHCENRIQKPTPGERKGQLQNGTPGGHSTAGGGKRTYAGKTLGGRYCGKKVGIGSHRQCGDLVSSPPLTKQRGTEKKWERGIPEGKGQGQRKSESTAINHENPCS